jgi:Putative transposase/Transposase zinc-binding domain
MACLAKDAGRPRFDIAEIVREHRRALEAEHPLRRQQRRVLTHIEQCRTAALGGHLDVCPSCDYERPAYNSCRDRHCPKCQALAQEKWIAERREHLLDVGHFHVVFTLPSELRKLAKFVPETIYGALFASASETLAQLARDRLRATLGTTMVLHTWTRDLRFHPHVHAIVSAGGLAHDGATWLPSARTFLFPVRVMGALLRGKMIATLRRLHARGRFKDFDDFEDPQAFDHLMSRIANKPWNVYAKAPFRKSQHVLDYLGRYTHRVGIANSRLLNVSSTLVTFRTKGNAVATLSPVQFLQRFVQHILPERFHKIRHFGLYASGAKAQRTAAHALLACTLAGPSVVAPKLPTPKTLAEKLLELLGRDISRCPQCGAHLEHRPLPPPDARAPPAWTAA